MRPSDREPIADVELERYRLGELPDDRRRTVVARLDAEPELRARLVGLDASDREFASMYPAHQMVEVIRAKARRAGPAAPVSRAPRRWLLQAAAVAACVCLVAAAVAVWSSRPRGDDTTIKGRSGPSLVIHRRVGDRSEPLENGARAREGDQVRIGYRASGARFGAILSYDGRGTLTQHWPRTGEQAAALEGTGTVLLDFAYELDDAPRWEAFYFVAADTPFDLEPVRRAIRGANANARIPASLDLPRGLAQYLVFLSKDQR